jgi:hypothetical protein
MERRSERSRRRHRHVLHLRVEHPDEPYTSAEPLGDFVFHFIKIVGR